MLSNEIHVTSIVFLKNIVPTTFMSFKKPNNVFYEKKMDKMKNTYVVKEEMYVYVEWMNLLILI